MLKVDRKSLIYGVAEFRKEIPHIIINLDKKDGEIVLTKRGKPIAILQDYEEYEKKESMIEAFEDLVLGYLAKEREEKSKDFISEEEMKKLIKKK